MQNQTSNTEGAKCKACEGMGWQLSVLDGLRHICPSCDGSGVYMGRQAQPVWLVPQYLPVYNPNPAWPQFVPWWGHIICKGTAGGTVGETANFGIIS
jgi:hypothetical protein